MNNSSNAEYLKHLDELISKISKAYQNNGQGLAIYLIYLPHICVENRGQKCHDKVFLE